MYTFDAVYTNFNGENERHLKIVIEEQFYDSEKDIYIAAMKKAYENCTQQEGLDYLEFISC